MWTLAFTFYTSILMKMQDVWTTCVLAANINTTQDTEYPFDSTDTSFQTPPYFLDAI